MPAPPESDAAIRDIDDLLASVGLRHGTRSLAATGFEPQPRHPRQSAHRPSRRAGKPSIEILRSPILAKIPWLIGGFSTRSGGTSTIYSPGQKSGELNLGFTDTDSRDNVLQNRSRFVREITGRPDFPLVTLRQIHSPIMRRVSPRDACRPAPWSADGLMTSDPGLLLAIQTADCIPVLIADRKRRAVAAFHAGWRGTLKRIVENGVGRMRLEFGSKPKDLVAAIGPGIGQCCYAVGEEVRSEFLSQFAYAEELFCDVYDSDPVKEKYPLLFLTARAPGHSNIGPNLHLDLIEGNRRQLLDAGLEPSAISIVGECTSCRSDRYFSYRASHGFTGRMFSVIGIKD
jgi:hypothetical protein